MILRYGMKPVQITELEILSLEQMDFKNRFTLSGRDTALNRGYPHPQNHLQRHPRKESGLKLSVLDQSPIRMGGTTQDAVLATID